LVEDGRIIFAASEERYSRIKMDDELPVRALQAAWAHTGLKPEQIDILAIAGFPPLKNWYYYTKSFWQQKIFTKGRDFLTFEYHIKQKRVVIKGLLAILLNLSFCTGLTQFFFLYLGKRIRLGYCLKGFRGKVIYVPHHFSHAAGACFCAGWEEALSVVIEGYDWQHSFVLEEFKKGRFNDLAKTKWPHSPGIFYRLVTTILGFDYLRHAGKVTGLAAFGDPAVLREKVNALLIADNMTLKMSPLVFILAEQYLLYDKLPAYFAGESRENIAAAFQKRLEEVVIEVITEAMTRSGKRKLVFSGGVAGNVLMNQRIHDLPGVEAIFICPPMGDSGLALGAALYAQNTALLRTGKYLQPEKVKDMYLGTGYNDGEIKEALTSAGVKGIFFQDIEKEIARLLAAKKVVARFYGRMEYGPRALGNRSILFHAGDNDVNDWLNKRLERTEFMPFAPSVLIEDCEVYFQRVKGAEHTAEFMTITFDCTEKMKKECPAVVHIDGTARPNFVKKEINPSYYRVIKEYKELTGVGVVLNTSFNMHEEPIVCSPYDAIRSFQRGHLDYLAIGNWLVCNE
ncbi:MAG: carbamoyltransferase C-terminal domain-containing protein, partial [bacterium]|nr:carbamoyltransferase C-terminal domain-containing protein [bacterium]